MHLAFLAIKIGPSVVQSILRGDAVARASAVAAYLKLKPSSINSGSGLTSSLQPPGTNKLNQSGGGNDSVLEMFIDTSPLFRYLSGSITLLFVPRVIDTAEETHAIGASEIATISTPPDDER